jgi:hypothetical protein
MRGEAYNGTAANREPSVVFEPVIRSVASHHLRNQKVEKDNQDEEEVQEGQKGAHDRGWQLLPNLIDQCLVTDHAKLFRCTTAQRAKEDVGISTGLGGAFVVMWG